jgi:type II secretory ATPase GspE/PulE/Tfp pilus assembly ATPase PilB-like protein
LGRFALFELLENDADFEALISTGGNSSVLAKAAREAGTIPLAVSALERVAAGDSTIEEIEREVEL